MTRTPSMTPADHAMRLVLNGAAREKAQPSPPPVPARGGGAGLGDHDRPRALMVSHIMPGDEDLAARRALALLKALGAWHTVDLVVVSDRPATLWAWREARRCSAGGLWLVPRSWLPWQQRKLPTELSHRRYRVMLSTSAAAHRTGAAVAATLTVRGEALPVDPRQAVAVLWHRVTPSTGEAAGLPLRVAA